jgi:hypothetical protein
MDHSKTIVVASTEENLGLLVLIVPEKQVSRTVSLQCPLNIRPSVTAPVTIAIQVLSYKCFPNGTNVHIR